MSKFTDFFFNRNPTPTHVPALPEEAKASRAATLVMRNFGAQWSDREYRAFAKEGFGQNPIVHQCINRIAEAVASIDIEAHQGEEILLESPLKNLLDNPSPNRTGDEFMHMLVSYLYLSGNAFIEGADVANVIREIYPLRPDRVGIEPNSTGFPLMYRYQDNGGEITFDVDDITGKSTILHMKMFNPLDDWRGMSPIEACAREIDIHNEASAFMKGLLDNSAAPSGALVMDQEHELTDEQFARMKTELEVQHAGAKNAGRPLLLEGGLDWKPMGFSPVDLAIIDQKNSAARNICLTLGVPPQLLGIPGDNTYSNYEVAREAFYEDTVIPLVKFIVSAFNGWGKLWNFTEKLVPDFADTPAMTRQNAEKWKMADVATELTVNEKRELKGYSPLPGKDGDVVLINSGQIPLANAGLGLGFGDDDDDDDGDDVDGEDTLNA